MRKVKIEGEWYSVTQSTARKYDWYWFKGKTYEKCPLKSDIVGYARVDDLVVGICKPVRKWFIPLAGMSVVALMVAVGYMGYLTLSRSYTVNHWQPQTANNDDVVGELDDGTERVNKKLAYSRYVTYDGSEVSLFYDTKNKSYQVAVGVDDKMSDYYPINEGYRIPIDLDMNPEDVRDGTLYLLSGNSVEEYPLVIEYMADVEEVVLPTGSPEEQSQARESIVEAIANTESNVTEEGGSSGNLIISGITDEGVHNDYENFGVLTVKGDEGP